MKNKEVGKLIISTNIFYRCFLEEDHRGNIFDCKFLWNKKKEEPEMFATVGSNRVSIYSCPNQVKDIVLEHAFEDPDVISLIHLLFNHH